MGLVSEFDAFCVSFSLNSNLVLSAVNYLAKKYIFRVASSLQTRFSILRFSSHLGKRTFNRYRGYIGCASSWLMGFVPVDIVEHI